MADCSLTIDGQTVRVPAGTTILEAAERIGITIPSLCHREGLPVFSSCMVCLVTDTGSGRQVPSCSVRVADGMQIVTDDETVRSARRDILELLFSEHQGDCEGPCRELCPAYMNIPLMLRQIERGDWAAAIRTVKQRIPLPAVLGRICPAPCEKGCRRGLHDEPVSICLLKRAAADHDLASAQVYRPTCEADSGKRVIVVGAGPAGMSAAYFLRRLGHSCEIVDENREPGGALARHVAADRLPIDVLQAEASQIFGMGIVFRAGTRLGEDVLLETLRQEADAVVLALGSTALAQGIPGIECTDKGMAVDRATMQTTQDGVFAIGGAVRETRMAVRAVADAHTAAQAIDTRFRTGKAVSAPQPLHSRMPKPDPATLARMLADAAEYARTEPQNEEQGFLDSEAVRESARCLRCDCRKPNTCKLRTLGQEYEIRPRRYAGTGGQAFESTVSADGVVFEPGKCMNCGLCVRITEQQRESLGLTFIGRGFQVRVGVPFDGTLEQALKHTASECIDACPTGALAWQQGEDT